MSGVSYAEAVAPRTGMSIANRQQVRSVASLAVIEALNVFSVHEAFVWGSGGKSVSVMAVWSLRVALRSRLCEWCYGTARLA